MSGAEGLVAPPWTDVPSTLAIGRDDVVVVDIGGTSIKIGHLAGGVVGCDGARHATDALTVEPVASLARLVRGYVESRALDPALVVVTVPGFIDVDFDRVVKAANVPALEGIALASALGEALERPVLLERDAVLLLEGERTAGALGSPADAAVRDEVLGVFLGTGIGAAAVSSGRPFRGGGWALELGHLPLPDVCAAATGGATLETLSGGVALAALAAGTGLAVEELFVALGPDDPRLERVVDVHAFAILAAWLGVAPHAVVLGGGVLDLPGYPWERLVARLDARVPAEMRARTRLRRARLGWQATLHGTRSFVAAATGSAPASTSSSPLHRISR